MSGFLCHSAELARLRILLPFLSQAVPPPTAARVSTANIFVVSFTCPTLCQREKQPIPAGKIGIGSELAAVCCCCCLLLAVSRRLLAQFEQKVHPGLPR